ncbi:MAG TPA: HEAT repeat domain-containing protein [Isosphaeraceae bacterium]|jgi:hypothetical protein|nr:HEAT repeat domain-containing protein [Isosphaeraceae bacterium]
MEPQENDEAAREAVREMSRRYGAYIESLMTVINLGERAIPVLVSELNHRKAISIVIALYHMMNRPGSDAAIPRLLDWAIGQCPLTLDVHRALVRAGDRIVPLLLERVRAAAAGGDAEAVRELLLGVAVELPRWAMDRLVPPIVDLLSDPRPDIREAAADSLGRIGLPEAAPAIPKLRGLREHDGDDSVRDSARDTLVRLGAIGEDPSK